MGNCRGALMNRMSAATIAVGLAAGSLIAGPAFAELSASEIVAKNAAARGGLEAWRKVETMVWIGHVESTHAPFPSMPFKLEQKRPNKTRMQIHALGDKSVRVFDGVHGWKVRPAHGRAEAQPYGQQELKFAQTGHGIDGPLIDSAAKGNSVSLEGVDDVGGRKAYHLKVHLAKGGTEDVWVDAETYLDLRYDRMTDGPSGTTRRVSAAYSDYRAVEGLQIPFLIETGGGGGAKPDKMQLESVFLNVPIEDSAFDNPTAPNRNSRKRPSFAPRASPQTAGSTAPASDKRGSAQR